MSEIIRLKSHIKKHPRLGLLTQNYNAYINKLKSEGLDVFLCRRNQIDKFFNQNWIYIFLLSLSYYCKIYPFNI